MTIDVHCHFYREEFLSRVCWDAEVDFITGDMGRIAGTELTLAEVKQRFLPRWFDLDGSANIKRMDEAGIERAVLLSMDLTAVFGPFPLDIAKQNEEIAKVVRRYPDRFIFCPQIEPQSPGALELFDRCLHEWDARALKFYPITGFAPDDEKLTYPFYERLVTRKLPLIVHVGSETNPLYKCEGAHPRHLDRVLVDFPDLTVIAAHFGLEWWRDLIALGQKRSNLMTDCTAWQPTLVGTYGRFCHVLRRFFNEMGTDRVMFGTDAPFFEHMLSCKQWVKAIEDLPRKSSEGVSFTEEEVYAILHGNAARVFGFPSL